LCLTAAWPWLSDSLATKLGCIGDERSDDGGEETLEQWRTHEIWGVQQIQLKTEGGENGDLGAVAPLSGVPLNLQSGSIVSIFRDVECGFEL
jgi:hypothetical protein